MIEPTRGNLLEADAEAVVNTVNCVGVMGKGIALQFKQAFPENFKAYAKACRAGKVQPGTMFIVPRGLENPKYIINFPTKRHWKGKSKISDIEIGLKALVQEIKRLDIQSIAVPPLGCGNGGLDWSEVCPLIESAFAEIPHVRVLLYGPQEPPKAESMPVRTAEPKMTRARSLLIKLMELYTIPGYKLSLLEIQKLAYFLQDVGEPLKLEFTKEKYGPYAENLNHVLQRIEGHFIRGYGDRSREVQVHLLPVAIQKANDFLDHDSNAMQRLQKISQLIDGFETPYGMELLSSVHWVAARDNPRAMNDDEAISHVHAWNNRKHNLFKSSHIRVAWERLHDEDWLP